MAVPLQIQRVGDSVWELPRSWREGMRVPVRIFATEALLHAMEANNLKRGVASLCIGGGEATAIAVERVVN